MKTTKKILHNLLGSLEIDLYGGAITSFHLHKSGINPLSFQLPMEQMPENNKAGAPYQGHFLCLGRWGKPSAGEIKAGVPDHGQVANILWESGENDHLRLEMLAHSELDGLSVKRDIYMDPESAIYFVNEEVTNTHVLGRLYNMVQHPTLAGPFLDNATIINCNAERGFPSSFSNDPEKYVSCWPAAICEDMTTINISNTDHPYSAVFSFIVKKACRFGWVTAFSPTHRLVLGYLWERKDYPWINLWQDWEEDTIRYRGIEFGTTGIHQSFSELIRDGRWKLFGEATFEYIDAGEKRSKKYLSFLYPVKKEFQGVEDVWLSKGGVCIKEHAGKENIEIPISLKGF